MLILTILQILLFIAIVKKLEEPEQNPLPISVLYITLAYITVLNLGVGIYLW